MSVRKESRSLFSRPLDESSRDLLAFSRASRRVVTGSRSVGLALVMAAICLLSSRNASLTIDSTAAEDPSKVSSRYSIFVMVVALSLFVSVEMAL
jgi:hypothetical protein